MEKNQKIIAGVLIALVVVLTGTIIYFAAQKNTIAPVTPPPVNMPTESMASRVTAPADQTNSQTQTPTTTNQNPKIKSLDDKWNLYTNEQAGFSMKIPKKVYLGIDPESNGNCPNTESVNIFENGKFIYITPEYSTSSGEKINCMKTNLELLNARWHNTEKDSKYVAGGWLMITGEAKNDQDLEKFIKNEIGDDCLGIESKKPSKEQPGVYDITVKTNPNGYCIMNFAYALKYSPKTGKVFYISMGQDHSFVLSPTPDVPFAEINSADLDMLNSFRVLGI